MKFSVGIRHFVLTAVCYLGLSLAVSAQGVGAIGGIVTDESGAVLPGATVTLSSSGLIGGNQVTISDSQGKYQFTRLVAGRYAVSAELQGFRTVMVKDVDVSADRTSRADLRMVIGTVSETVTVSGQAPLLDTSSAAQQTVMSRDVLDTVPTGADIYSIARLAPAITVSKIDVGGKEMIAQSTLYVHGSTNQENEVQMDGMSVSHYSSGTGGSVNYYLDSAQAEEMNYLVGSTSAERAVGGVITNVVTKTGTNALRVSGMYSGTSQSFQANNLTPQLRTQLLAGVPAAALAANPNIVPGGEIALLFDSALGVTGPAIRDRLWFFGHTKLGKSNQYKVGSYNSDGTQLLSDNTLLDYLLKGSWAVTPKTQFHYFWTWQLKGRYHVAGGPTVTQFFDTRASAYNPSDNTINAARWTTVLSPKMVVEASGITMNGQTDTLPQKDVQIGEIPRFDSITRTNTVAAATYSYNNGWRAHAQASLTYYAGPHNLKLGWQMYQTRSVGGGWSVYTPEGYGLRAVFRNGVPDSVNTYNTPTKSVERSRDHGVYLQDNWRPMNKLTLNLGVRFQTGHGWIDTPLCQEATPFIAGQCFDHPTGVPLWKNVVPRASAIYDVFGNGRTAVKVSANRYLIPLGVTVIGRLDPISLQNDTRSWTDRNRDLIPQFDELGPSTGFNLGTTNRYVDHLRQPIVNELSTEFQQQLPGQVVVSAGYYYRGHRDMIGSTNVAVPRESYTPITVTEVVSGRRVTVYNQDPATLGKFDVVWSNQPEQDRNFHGVDLTIRKSMARRWMMMGSASWGKSDIDIAGTVDLNNPNFTFRRGPESNERPFFLKVSSAYQAPLGVTVAANFQHYLGLPETTTVQVTSATVRLTQVNQTLVVDPVGTIRQPDVSLLDLNVQRPFTLGKMRLDPRIDVFNLLNSSGITSYVAQLGPSYGRAIEVIGGRLIKFGVNFNF
jgi:hypothetical protein